MGLEIKATPEHNLVGVRALLINLEANTKRSRRYVWGLSVPISVEVLTCRHIASGRRIDEEKRLQQLLLMTTEFLVICVLKSLGEFFSYRTIVRFSLHFGVIACRYTACAIAHVELTICTYRTTHSQELFLDNNLPYISQS